MLGARVSVGRGACLGIRSSVGEGCRIGAGAVVADHAAVEADVPDGQSVRGVPARPMAP